MSFSGTPVVASERRRGGLRPSRADLEALNATLTSAASEWRTTVDTIDAPIIVLEVAGSVRRMNHAAEATIPTATAIHHRAKPACESAIPAAPAPYSVG